MTKTTIKTPEQILAQAADLIEQGYWLQGSYHGVNAAGELCHCADGALAVIAGRSRPEVTDGSLGIVGTDFLPVTDREYDAINEAYRTAYFAAGRAAAAAGSRNDSIIGYNDQPRRTKEEVAAVLRAAIEYVPAVAEARAAGLRGS